MRAASMAAGGLELAKWRAAQLWRRHAHLQSPGGARFRFPGITELGSVWLPLPHLLMLPLVSGLPRGGPMELQHDSPSCGLPGCLVGIYRLARRWLNSHGSAGIAFLALNPNLLYLQTTAMTEPLFCAR